MSEHIGDPGHGHSPAAWTAVVIMLVGFSIGTVAFFLAIEWLVWASVGIIVVGFLAGVVMARMGYGAHSPRYANLAKDH